MNEQQKRKLLSSGKAVFCCNCGVIGWPKKITKGSFIIEIGFWFFGLLSLVLFLPLGLLLLLAAFVYSIWRMASRFKGCSMCKSRNIVPVSSPVAQQAIMRNPGMYQ